MLKSVKCKISRSLTHRHMHTGTLHYYYIDWPADTTQALCHKYLRAAQWHSIIEIIRMKISYSTNFVFMHRGTGVLQCKLCVVPAAICCVCSMLVLSMENGENEEYGEKYTQEWVRSRKVKRFVYDFHINRHSTWCVVENCSSSEPNGKMLR